MRGKKTPNTKAVNPFWCTDELIQRSLTGHSERLAPPAVQYHNHSNPTLPPLIKTTLSFILYLHPVSLISPPHVPTRRLTPYLSPRDPTHPQPEGAANRRVRCSGPGHPHCVPHSWTHVKKSRRLGVAPPSRQAPAAAAQTRRRYLTICAVGIFLSCKWALQLGPKSKHKAQAGMCIHICDDQCSWDYYVILP